MCTYPLIFCSQIATAVSVSMSLKTFGAFRHFIHMHVLTLKTQTAANIKFSPGDMDISSILSYIFYSFLGRD